MRGILEPGRHLMPMDLSSEYLSQGRIHEGPELTLYRASHDVIHKDIKPENFLVEPASGEVKLGGLGIASLLPGERGSMHAASLFSLGTTSAEALRRMLSEPFGAWSPGASPSRDDAR